MHLNPVSLFHTVPHIYRPYTPHEWPVISQHLCTNTWYILLTALYRWSDTSFTTGPSVWNEISSFGLSSKMLWLSHRVLLKVTKKTNRVLTSTIPEGHKENNPHYYSDSKWTSRGLVGFPPFAKALKSIIRFLIALLLNVKNISKVFTSTIPESYLKN